MEKIDLTVAHTPPRLFDQVRAKIRLNHYSLQNRGPKQGSAKQGSEYTFEKCNLAPVLLSKQTHLVTDQACKVPQLTFDVINGQFNL